MKLIDITGQKFGRLTALYRLHNYHKQGTYWLCVCECGNFTEVYLGNLRKDISKSCGCLNKELTYKRSIKHGKYRTRLYRTWKGIKRRCYNRHDHAYNRYGGRGIKVCDEWLHDFMEFYKWALNNGYRDTLTIDRIDVNGNYSPSNCRWATPKQQARNTRSNKYITINGETHCLKEWCEKLNLNYTTVFMRLYRGQAIVKALELE